MQYCWAGPIGTASEKRLWGRFWNKHTWTITSNARLHQRLHPRLHATPTIWYRKVRKRDESIFRIGIVCVLVPARVGWWWYVCMRVRECRRACVNVCELESWCDSEMSYVVPVVVFMCVCVYPYMRECISVCLDPWVCIRVIYMCVSVCVYNGVCDDSKPYRLYSRARETLVRRAVVHDAYALSR